MALVRGGCLEPVVGVVVGVVVVNAGLAALVAERARVHAHLGSCICPMGCVAILGLPLSPKCVYRGMLALLGQVFGFKVFDVRLCVAKVVVATHSL